MADQNRSRSRADAHATREREQTDALTELGLTPPEVSLFHVVQYGLTLPPPHLPARAASESYRVGGAFTEDACRAALSGCLNKGWLQVIDETVLDRIADELRAGRFLGPIYGLPSVGDVDFTATGAALWERFRDRPSRAERRAPFAYSDVLREKTVRYFRTRTAAIAGAVEARSGDDVVSVTEPVPTGPWRAQWWRRFPAGYRIDVEERGQWQDRGSGGDEDCYLDRSARTIDPARLRSVLDRHNVTIAEWLLLASMERAYFRDSVTNLVHGAVESANREFGADVTEAECGEGLDACLRYGWLRVHDQQSLDEVRSLLRDDPTLLAVPRTAENRPRECCCTFDPLRPGTLVPVPMPDTRRYGQIDFSPAGATLYRMISAEWLGADWEDDLCVARGYEWEEHRYSAEEGERPDLALEETSVHSRGNAWQ